MILKLKLGPIRMTFTAAYVVDVIGVNSKLDDGNHILMWDFDHTTLDKVKSALSQVQYCYVLPNIYILKTLPDENFIAYCFSRHEWQKAVEIIASTRGVCWNFFKWGVFRKRFTLRVGPKCNRKPQLATVLPSSIPEDAAIDDLKSWVKYETLPDNRRNIVIRAGLRKDDRWVEL